MDGCLLKSSTDSFRMPSSASAAGDTMDEPEDKTSGLGSFKYEALASGKAGSEGHASFQTTFGTDGGSIG